VNSRPNVLWIVADHQIHGSCPLHLDLFPLQKQLTQLGSRFNRAYSVLPICSPARASMLTGLYPHAHGLTENDGRFGGREGLDQNDWMLHHSLSDAGYRCGWFGKWHVDNAYSAIDYGFEGYSQPGYGYPYGDTAYIDYLQRNNLSKPRAKILIENESGLATGTKIDLCTEAQWFDYVSGVAALETPAQTHEAYFVTDLAKSWINSVDGAPYFLRVDPWGPHPPYLLAEPFIGMLDHCSIELPKNFYSNLSHRPEHHQRYRDFWSASVGLDEAHWRRQFQCALEHAILVETALAGLIDSVDLDNTLIIFNSDHGDALGTNGGVANKGDLMVEATMQIPLLMAGPGIPKNGSSDLLVSNLDLVPTVLEYCGVESNQPFHGINLIDGFDNSKPPLRSGLMTQHYGLQEPIVQRAWYRDCWKLVICQDGFRELYNLSNDPDELINLALDPGYKTEVCKMERGLLAEMERVGDDNLPVRNSLQASLAEASPSN